MPPSRERQDAIDRGKYSGADYRAEHGSSWQDSAETQLRRHARQQAETIKRLEKDVRRLQREVAELNRQLALKDTLPMKRQVAR